MKLEELIKTFPFSKDEPIILALSGGKDSMALFHLLFNNGYNVIVAHINHHKREQSKIEEQYIDNFCKTNDINCHIEHFIYHGDNFQAEAHKFRYNFFLKIAQKYNSKYILTAHHLEDQVETIILRLCQGSNLYGYGGISKLRELKNNIYIYRPLLETRLEDIYDYIKENKIKYFEDESNHSDDYLRNKIRHQIVPLFKDLTNIEVFNRYSIILKESFNLIRQQSIKYLNEHNKRIDIKSFINLDIALQKDILVYLLEQNNIKPSFTKIEEILKVINSSKPQIIMHLANNLSFIKEYQICYIKLKENLKVNSIQLNLEERVIFNHKYQFYLTKNKCVSNENYLKLCYNQEELPLCIRTKIPGDKVTLSYGSKKLARLFIDKKISLADRESLPIVTTKNNEIILVYNCYKKRIDNSINDNYIYLYFEEIKNGTGY